MYLTIFKTVIDDTVTAFRPSSIVLQCGADSLGCDRLGAFNLSIAAHGECVNFVRKFGVPLLVVGGGGYTVKNVGRCWTYETAVLVGASLPDELPLTIYDPFFRDSQWKLHPPLTGKVDNQNSPTSLQRITMNIRSKLRYLQGAPSVMMSELPPDLERWLEEEKEARDKDADENPESRLDRSMAQNEFYDGNGDHDKDEEEPERAPSRRRRTTRVEDPNTATTSTRSRGGRRRGRPPKTSVSATPLTTTISIDDETDESTPALRLGVAAVAEEVGAEVEGGGGAAYRPDKWQRMLMISRTSQKERSLRRMLSRRWFHRPRTRLPKQWSRADIWSLSKGKRLIWMWYWLDWDF
jgi:hypothetical protein